MQQLKALGRKLLLKTIQKVNSSNFTFFIVSTEACDTYQRWKEEELDINHLFSLEKREYRYKVTLLHVIVGDFDCLEEEISTMFKNFFICVIL